MRYKLKSEEFEKKMAEKAAKDHEHRKMIESKEREINELTGEVSSR